MLSIIVLAAGSSTRMGDQNKMLLPFGDRTVIETTLFEILGARKAEWVLGRETEKFQELLGSLPVILVQNPDYEKGMTSSIQHGVKIANGKGYMICLGDMPLISSDEYNQIQKRFEECVQLDHKCICIPEYKWQRGNPVIFSSYYKQAILQHDEPEGWESFNRT
jgi:molybdenum cofactor cytidylyltransferase